MAGIPVHPDPAFPRLHGRPPRGWVNDPNGLSYIDGRYHVFFQYNPDAAHHAAIKWGHVSSTDLVRWEPEPVALVNRPGELDSYGCWTGCVVDDRGTPTAVYSGVVEDSGRSAVLLAHSDRTLRRWVQRSDPVAAMPADALGAAPRLTDVRDPFVFELAGHRYALQGAGHRAGSPSILLYGCDDLRHWTELGTLLTTDDPVAGALTTAQVWECPNLALIDGRWVLVVSLWRQLSGSVVLDQVRYLVGDLSMDEGRPRFRPFASGRLDTGPCFYAPQLLSRSGRTLMWGWAREFGRSKQSIDQAGWAGSLTFCRELSVVGDAVVSRPAAELQALRGEPFEVAPGRAFAATAFELELAADAGPMSLWLVDGNDSTNERLVAQWTAQAGPVVPARLLVDGSMVEVFDGGPTAYTTRAYPSVTSRWEVRGGGHAGVALRAWPLALRE